MDAIALEINNDSISRNGLVRVIEIDPMALSDEELKVLTDFLHTLTDPATWICGQLRLNECPVG